MSDVLTPLASAFRYTPDDLRANRQYYLSGRQRRRLWTRFWTLALGAALLFTVPIFLALGLALWSTDQSIGAAMNDTRTGLGYAVGFILGIFYVIANWSSLWMFFDLLRGRVTEITGPAQVWGRYLIVKDFRFVVDDHALQMLQSGVAYRVFILPRSKTLLSIEFAE
jgi:hypothetical protein